MTARQLLELMLASRHLTTPAAIPEYAPFAYSLASVLQDLVKAKQLSASSSFWQVAVGKVLLALVDADSQVREARSHKYASNLLLLQCRWCGRVAKHCNVAAAVTRVLPCCDCCWHLAQRI